MKPGHYSPHFTRLEMLASETSARKGINNIPSPVVEKNLKRVCVELLEPLRARFGPIRVSSGYRCPALNSAVGGSDMSAHMVGRAADVQLLDPQFSLREALEWLMGHVDLPVDQAILEFGAWLHVAVPAEGIPPRRQALMVFAGTPYMNFDPTDTRVS